MPSKSKNKKSASPTETNNVKLDDIMEDVEPEEMRDGVDPTDDDFNDGDYVADAAHESESDDPDDPDEPTKVQLNLFVNFTLIYGKV